MHHTEAEPRLLHLSAVPALRDSGLFDDVVLCVADVPENDVLAGYAAAWGIEMVRGPEHDVAARIAATARSRGATTIARALVWWFFGDLALIERQLELLESGTADWVDLPRDFDLRFGVDAFRLSFLEKIERAFARDPALMKRYGLNPWSFAEQHPGDFGVITCDTVPCYGQEDFERIQSSMRDLWPERWDGAGTPLYPYALAGDLVRHEQRRSGRRPRALDVASGLGAGTAFLGEMADTVGVDLDAQAVRRCRKRYGDRAQFLAGDALSIDLAPESFDVVTSVHTLEHVQDDRAFLAGVHSWLKPGGHLVLEVPFLARRPFAEIDQPLSPGHVREYDPPSLLDLVGERFEITATSGVARGAYVELERARSAGLVVGRKAA